MGMPPKPNQPPIWLVVLIGSFILLGVISFFRSAGTTPASTSQAVAAEPSAPVALKVTDIELSRAYHGNEVAAQRAYGDRTLWVKGIVTGVTLDIMSHPVVQMRSVNEFLPVQAKFDDSAKDSLSAISKGDLITMQCTDITEVISAPILSGCSLMDNSVK